MATKIAPFTLKEADTCVKCGKPMPAGTEVTWLREPERKGYYHRNEEALPTIAALTKVKVPADNMLGYVWARPNAEGRYVPPAPPPSQQPAVIPVTPRVPATVPLPDPPLNRPTISADGILLNALAQSLLPALKAALEIEQPRIVVNIYVPKPGDEQKALAALSSELYLLLESKQG